MNFNIELHRKIISSISNSYVNNYDYLRFGRAKNLKWNLNKFLKKFLLKRGFIKIQEKQTLALSKLLSLTKYYKGFETLYEKLNNNESKNRLVSLIAYRVLGPQCVNLIDDVKLYWETIKILEKETQNAKSLPISFNNWKIYKFDLKNLFNIPIKLYQTVLGICVIFHLKQYEYNFENISIDVENGDTVIDAGACRGEASLKFAHKAGENGKVYSFEFIAENIKILEKNISLNPELEKRIEIVKKPLWDRSNQEVFIFENGPGSKISFEKFEGAEKTIKTLCIDDLVINNKIEKIDFIKMDIEGAEQPALNGAIETIKKYKPKLAISIYHSLEDFTQIVEWIDSLDLGYKFYLGHYTLHLEETVLYAKV